MSFSITAFFECKNMQLFSGRIVCHQFLFVIGKQGDGRSCEARSELIQDVHGL